MSKNKDQNERKNSSEEKEEVYPTTASRRLSKAAQLARVLSQPDYYQSTNSMPLEPSQLYCWTTYFQGWMHCQGISGQLTSMYRKGTFSNCDVQWKNFGVCRGLAHMSEDTARLELLKIRMKRQNSTANVWKYHDEPSKQWMWKEPPESDSNEE